MMIKPAASEAVEHDLEFMAISPVSIPLPDASSKPEDLPVWIPHTGTTSEKPVAEAISCHRRAMRKTKRFGGRHPLQEQEVGVRGGKREVMYAWL